MDEMWKHLAKINHRFNISANAFFEDQGALYAALPLRTRMISSPFSNTSYLITCGVPISVMSKSVATSEDILSTFLRIFFPVE